MQIVDPQNQFVALTATFSLMPTVISQRELRNDSADIMRRLEEGETFIVTRHGKQVGVLHPMQRPQFSRMADVVDAFRGLPHISYQEMRKEHDQMASQDIVPQAYRD